MWPSCGRNWDWRDQVRCSPTPRCSPTFALEKRIDRGFRLWWLGQSGFLLQWQGIHVLLDPYLSDSLTRKYSQTDKPHVRMTELVIDPAELSFVDIATSSHNHTDHLDAETLGPILASNPSLKLVIPEANRAFVADRLKIEPAAPIGLDDESSIELSGIRFSGIASAHETIERDEHGRVKALGYVLDSATGASTTVATRCDTTA